MPERLSELLRDNVAFWVAGSLQRDIQRELREKGKRPPIFARAVLEALAIAAGHPVDTARTASGTPPVTVDPTSWISVHEAAARRGLSEGRIRKLARSGQIRAKRVGRDWQIDQHSL